MSFPRRLLSAAAILVVAATVGTPGTTQALARAPSAPVAATKIILTVTGCEGCRVQPVQTNNGTVTYWGPERAVADGSLRFQVPTARTQHMSFLVYAPFDEVAQDGIPMVAVTRFLAMAPGKRVTDAFARQTRELSGCWKGTGSATFRNTLVVKRRTLDGRTVAAGYFRRTLPSYGYFVKVRKASYHVSDPSICA